MAENTSYFMNAQAATGFGTTSPGDEKAHRAANAAVDSPAAVETVFVGFNVPEADIHSLDYLWLHPNLKLMSGGVWCWQGMKPRQLESEIFDMRDFTPDTPLQAGGDLDDITLPGGYRHQVITPLEKVRITYADEARGNAFDVTLTAVMPPAMLPSNKHFDQAMKTEGMLLLRGKPYAVDGLTIRDRSWGEARTEDPVAMPPIHWLAMCFDENFVIHVTGLEEVDTAPWRDVFAADPAFPAGFNRGWVWRDGTLKTLAAATVETFWDGLRQSGHRVRVTDSDGREYVIDGEIRAASTWHTWSNVHMSIALARWTCEGRVGHGDSQIAMWTDFVRAAAGHTPAAVTANS